MYEAKTMKDEELPVQAGCTSLSERKEFFSPHWHEYIELHRIISGNALFQIDQRQISAVPGDIIVVNSNELHSGYATSVPYESQVVIMAPEELAKGFAHQYYRFNSKSTSNCKLLELFDKFFAELKNKSIGYKQMSRAILTEMLVNLFRYEADDILPKKEFLLRRKALNRLEPVLEFIEKGYSEKITVKQLADMLCLSEDRFAHLFRDGVKRSPVQYINEVRLNKAMALLQTGEYTVTEVAVATGFSDYNNFGRLFRKQYGLTPNQARQGKLVTDGLKDSGIV